MPQEALRAEELPSPSVLSPELQAAVEQVLRQGECVRSFVEAAVKRQVEQRRLLAMGGKAQESAPAASSPPRHAADELLGQLDAWLGIQGSPRAEAR